MTVLWCEAQFPEPALHLLVLLCLCSQCPSLMPGWGWWPGCFSTGRKNEQRQVHPPSVLSPQLTRLLLLSRLRADLSWSSQHEGRYMGYPGQRQEMNERENNWRPPYGLNWHFSVSCEVSRDEGHPKGQICLSGKGLKISNHGHASRTGTWWPGHALIGINDRR